MSALGILGVGVVGPGLPDWTGTSRVLAGTLPYAAAPLPSLTPSALPPNERRRATLGTRLALEAGAQALAGLNLDPRGLRAVFAASESDLAIVDRLCTDIFGQRVPVSPTLFHNSVHNATAGYWSIAQGCRQASTSLSAWDGSLAAGLLECGALGACEDSERPLLLVAYDSPGPQPLDAHRPLAGPFACALALVPEARCPSLPRPPLGTIAIALDPGGSGDHDRLSPGLDPALERLRTGNPAARILPVLERIATGQPGRVRLPYLDDLDLIVQVS